MMKKSRLLGLNRRSSVRLMKCNAIKFKRAQSAGTIQSPVSNEMRCQSVSMLSKKRNVRLKDLTGKETKNRAARREVYDGLKRRKCLMRKGEFKLRYKSGESVRSDIETRLDLLLWRSGLAVSLRIASSMIVQGHVGVRKSSTVLETVCHPAYAVKSGEMVYVKDWLWVKLVPVLKKHWSSKHNRLSVPSYVYTDFTNGTVLLMNRPLDKQVLMPMGLSVSLMSIK